MKYIVTLLLLLGSLRAENTIYVDFGIGGATIDEPTRYENYTSIIKNDPTSINIQLALDFGAYWKQGDNLLLGISVNGMANSYVSETDQGQMNYYLYSLSAWYFLNESINGLYLRADAGLGLSVWYDVNGYDFLDTGLGGLAGIGLKLGWFKVEANMQALSLGGDTVTSTNILVGIILDSSS